MTFIFGTHDEMKQIPIKFWGGMEWNYGAISENIMSSALSSLDQSSFNLFSVPMFPVCNDPCDSLLMSLSLYYKVRGDKALAASYANQVEGKDVLYHTSLKDAAKCKSVKRLTAIRAPPPGVCLQSAVLR